MLINFFFSANYFYCVHKEKSLRNFTKKINYYVTRSSYIYLNFFHLNLFTSIKEKRFLIIYLLESTLYFIISNNISYAFSPKGM